MYQLDGCKWLDEKIEKKWGLIINPLEISI